jgi:SAM-dependent methyltransferase
MDPRPVASLDIPMMSRLPLPVHLYLRAHKALPKLFGLISAAFVGFWLGILSRRSLLLVDDAYYVGPRGGTDNPDAYESEEYNRRGLWAWEQAMIEEYFAGASRLLVLACGGGREVLALQRLGYEADGFECQPILVDAANRLLVADGFTATVQVSPRDSCPTGDRRYSGVIVGWGGYTLVAGRHRRVALLQQVRERLEPGGMILISFFARRGTPRRFRLVAAMANALRWPLGRERVEPGDYLSPNYVHFFTQEEIRGELEEAGFDLLHYGTAGYGHAVGALAGELGRTGEQSSGCLERLVGNDAACVSP